jgi:hypothetical protein
VGSRVLYATCLHEATRHPANSRAVSTMCLVWFPLGGKWSFVLLWFHGLKPLVWWLLQGEGVLFRVLTSRREGRILDLRGLNFQSLTHCLEPGEQFNTNC